MSSLPLLLVVESGEIVLVKTEAIGEEQLFSTITPDPSLQRRVAA